MGAWLRGIFSETFTGEGSMRRTLLALAVLSTLAVCLIQVWKRGLDAMVKETLMWLNGTLAVLAGHGKTEERKAALAGLPGASAGPPAPSSGPPGPPAAP